MKEHLFLAFNNLRRRKLRAWLTILGIFIGIAAVVSLISLGSGLREAITGQFGTLSTDKLTIQNSGTGFGPPGSTSIRKLTSNDIEVIQQVEGVEEAIPRLIRIGKVEYNKIATFIYIASIPENQKQIEIVYETFNPETESGRLLRETDRKKIVIGSEVAKKNNAFEKEIITGKNILIQGEEFQVIGVLKASSSIQVNSAILMMEDDLEDILNIEDETDLIVAQIKKGYDIEEVAEKIEEQIRRDRNEKLGEEDFSVQTPLQALSSVNTILTIINVIVAGIAAISLVVGAVGITNTMYTSVLERKKEIGTLKAIGARNEDILQIFLFESGLLGLIGGIIGAVIGVGIAFSVSAIANLAFGSTILEFKISYTLVILSIVFATFIGAFSGLLPARQASKLNPVDALRG